nr:EAL domain-containing protein [Acholeplasmatales bacterium]
ERISKRLLYGYKKIGDYKPYYLEGGVFAICAYSRDKIDKIKNEIIKDINTIYCEGKRFVPDAKTVIASVNGDFDSLDKALSFDGLLSKVFFGKSDDINYSFKKNDSLFEMKVNLKSILADAILNKTFEVYYQPIYNLKEKKFNCVEALIRLNHPKYGFISPGYFIPFAEENGLVEKIDEIMIEKVIEFINSKEFKKYEMAYVEINVSTIELAKRNFAKDLVETFKKNNINPDNIVVEVLESYNVAKLETVSRNIQVLRDNNIKLALDDFGTGYSNLKRFTEIDLSYVKIDKSLIDKIENPVYNKIIENQFDLIRQFNRQIVAEGVEEEAQVKFLEKLKCDFIQGFYYSRPLPLPNLITFLEDN